MTPKALTHFDVVVLPFPYSDNIEKSKRRPVVIVSKNAAYHKKTGKVIVAMITSSHEPWPGDVIIHDVGKAGLGVNCVIRMKLFTLEQKHILAHIGRLSAKDQKSLKESLSKTLIT